MTDLRHGINRGNPWDPREFGPLRLTEDFLWQGRTVVLRALYVVHKKKAPANRGLSQI